MSEQGMLLSSEGVNELTLDGARGWFMEEQNASTGYSWKYHPDNSGVYELVEEVSLAPAVPVVGAPGKIIWELQGVREGTGKVMFEEYPPGSKQPSKVVPVEIKVVRKS